MADRNDRSPIERSPIEGLLRGSSGGVYREWLLPLTTFFLGMAFLACPFPFQTKAHALLHGLCAQTPSHTLRLGDRALPFDARMTGIYIGFLGALMLVMLAGRRRSAGLPNWKAGILLVAFVGVMAIDGFNSLFTDLGRPTLYEPDNRLRLLTGLSAGISLGVVLSMLMAMSLWTKPRVQDRILEKWWEPLGIFAALLPVAGLTLTGAGMLYYPFAGLLIVSATIVLSALSLVVVTMLRGLDNRYDRWSEIQAPASLGLVLGVAVMLGLAGLRFALEAITNAPPLT